MATHAVDVRRFTREEYEELAETGFFQPDERLELVDGIIYRMTPQSSRHAAGCRLAQRALERAFGDGYDVRGQMPLALGLDAEPEPDVAVVAGGPRDHARAHPATALLVVEVADSSLPFDRERKAALYAGAGIAEYWLLNLIERQLELLRDPEPGRNAYRTRIVLRAGERIAPLARPEAEIAVADLLP